MKEHILRSMCVMDFIPSQLRNKWASAHFFLLDVQHLILLLAFSYI